MTTSTTNPEIGSRLDVSGISTNYHDHGDPTDEPPVLLLHGSGPGVSAWANWRTALPGLSAGRRVLAPNIVRFGYTDRPDDFGYTRENWVSHLVGFLDALGLDKVSLVGNSFGGALALWLAHRHPERVHRLVLMDGQRGRRVPAHRGTRRRLGLHTVDRGHGPGDALLCPRPEPHHR